MTLEPFKDKIYFPNTGNEAQKMVFFKKNTHLIFVSFVLATVFELPNGIKTNSI